MKKNRHAIISLNLFKIFIVTLLTGAALGTSAQDQSGPKEIQATANRVTNYHLKFGQASKTAEADSKAFYSNLVNLESYMLNGGAEKQTNNIITKMLVDSLGFAGAFPHTVTDLYFSVYNANTVPVGARVRMRFYKADGPDGGPGTYIQGFSFNPIVFDARRPLVYHTEFEPGSFVLEENSIWMGILFDNNDGSTGATLAQMNNIGMLLFDPVEVGSSDIGAFETTKAGSFVLNNPEGEKIYGSDDSEPFNFGWEFIGQETVPVTLSDIRAVQKGNVNVISWKTAQESNSSHFEVEHSSNGTDFSKIGMVKAAGNSSVSSSYHYTDATPASGNNYYRLRMVDKDNSYKYSRIVSVKNPASFRSTIYPSPARNNLTLEWNAEKAEAATVSITNAGGMKVLTKEVSGINGKNKLALDISKLPGGIYYLRIQTVSGNEVLTFSKL